MNYKIVAVLISVILCEIHFAGKIKADLMLHVTAFYNGKLDKSYVSCSFHSTCSETEDIMPL